MLSTVVVFLFESNKFILLLHAEVHIMIVPWLHFVNDIDLCRSLKSPKIHKPPILAFKVIQGHWIR